MKISKTKLRKVITEELQNILAEESDGKTLNLAKVRRDQAKRARHNAEKEFFGSDIDPLVTSDVVAAADMDTKAIDMDAVVQQQMDSMVDPAMYREEARRLFDVFFGGRNEYGMELLANSDDALEEVIEKLVGWMFPQTFRGNQQPSPMFVKVAQEFEKERIPIINNEDHFLDRVEDKVLAIAKKGFADTGAGSEEDFAALTTAQQREIKSAAETYAVDQVISLLRQKDPDSYGNLPSLQSARDEEVEQLMRDVPRVAPEAYRAAYKRYINKYS